MIAPALLITGTGRCGTGYIAQVLQRCDVACGHEGYWHPEGIEGTTLDLDADASWCALALGLEGYRGVIGHQVRHPLDVVSSLVKNPTTEGPYLELQRRLLPWQPDDPVTLAMLTAVVYARAAEAVAHRTWRLEDLAEPTVVAAIANMAGHRVTPSQAAAALAEVPTDYNWHGDGARLEWVDLPESDLRNDLMRWAKAMGWH